MKYFSLFIFFSIFFVSLSFKCCYNEIKKPELKIINATEKIDSKRRLLSSTHNIDIYIDYEILKSQVSSGEITSSYYNNLASALNSTINYISKLLIVNNAKEIFLKSDAFNKTEDYILKSEVNDIVNKVISTDLILIPKIYFDDEGIDAAAFTIAINKNEKNRPICGGILLGKHYNFNKINAQPFLIMLLLHEITHVLGFSSSLFEYFKTYPSLIKTKTVNGLKRTLYTGPNVIKQAKRHFNCDNIEGIELENQGGDGSVGSHWEARIMLGDYMISIDYPEIVISEISLALLEDSGWYNVNYYTGGLFRYGKGLGCDFLNNKCVSEGKSNYEREFCDVENEERCTSGFIDRGFCYIDDYPYLPEYYRYFNNTNKGGFYFADYCPVTMTNSNYYKYYYFYSRCDFNGLNFNNLPSEYGEIYGPNSICVLSSLIPSTNNDQFNSEVDTKKRARCHKVISCDSKSRTFILNIGDTLLNCSGNYKETRVDGYSGSIICPDYNRVCTGSVWCNDPLICIEKQSLYDESLGNGTGTGSGSGSGTEKSEKQIDEDYLNKNETYLKIDCGKKCNVSFYVLISIIICLLL